MKKVFISLLTLSFSFVCYSQLAYKSNVWVSDNGDGTYKNPILYSDYSDPDLCRVGDDYYMTASSFNCVPGLPILHSRDLVNWQLVNYALPRLMPEEYFERPRHGDGVWAPSIRCHEGMYYIYWGDPDFGFYMTKTSDPMGEWSEPEIVKAGNGLIDCCPFWDEDGNAYLSNAFAGSRAGEKSVIAISRLSVDGSHTVGEPRIVFDGHENQPTCEGSKLYKRNGYYYILLPAGGVSTGWQLALRSKNIWGPYEEKIVMRQGASLVNGPHQGGWVTTPDGKEDWFVHFQDVGACGRILHLQPMAWKKDWPVIGEDKDGDGCGDPVMTHKKPRVAKRYPIQTPPENDEFDNENMGLQWQWYANPNPLWSYLNFGEGYLRLYSVYTDSVKNLWDVPNLLMQKLTAPNLTATAKVKIRPDKRYVGEKFNFVMLGQSYGMISVESTDNGLMIRQVECDKADKGSDEVVNETHPIEQDELYLRLTLKNGSEVAFSYSFDGTTFNAIGKSFKAEPEHWVGAKMGFCVQRPKKSNDGGWMDIDWFRVTKPNIK